MNNQEHSFLIMFQRSYSADQEYLEDLMNVSGYKEDQAMIQQMLLELNEAKIPFTEVLGATRFNPESDEYYIFIVFHRGSGSIKYLVQEIQFGYDHGYLEGTFEVLVADGSPVRLNGGNTQ